MTFFQKLSLRNQMLLVVICIVLSGFALTLSFFTHRAAQIQQETATLYVSEMAADNGARAAIPLQQALEAARTLAAVLGSMQADGQASREAANAMLRRVLEHNPRFLGVWTGWEPQAFDGRDESFVGAQGHDATGRYVPYWSRDAKGVITVEALTDYDKPGPGDFYQVSKSTGQNALLEPYPYVVGGKQMLITTLSAPIVINGRFVGVAGVDIALDFMQEMVGSINIYETGYASLLSYQGVHVGDRDPARVGHKLDTSKGLSAQQVQDLLEAVRTGQRYETETYVPALESNATRIQVPLRLDGISHPWSFGATVPSSKILHEVKTLQWLGASLGLLSIVLVSVGLGLAIDRLVLRPIGGEPRAAALLAERVAQGDLTSSVSVRPGDNFSLMYQLGRMQEGLVGVVAQVRTGAQSVALASAEIASGNHDLSGRTESQASALEETAASMEQLNATVRQNADNAINASTLAQDASRIAEEGGAAVAKVVQSMQHINEGSRQIYDIIGVIDGIAFQTNILALNAAVEAARAGEQGRGFAVVAGEVRVLAQRSAEAAREIKNLISSSVQQTETGTQQVDEAGSTIEQVVQSIHRVNTIVAEISSASREQSAGVSQVGEAVTQMDQVTQQNAALVEEMAAAANGLQQQADALVQTVSIFRLADAGDAPALPRLGMR